MKLAVLWPFYAKLIISEWLFHTNPNLYNSLYIALCIFISSILLCILQIRILWIQNHINQTNSKTWKKLKKNIQIISQLKRDICQTGNCFRCSWNWSWSFTIEMAWRRCTFMIFIIFTTCTSQLNNWSIA